jgi:hypothetical protein
MFAFQLGAALKAPSSFGLITASAATTAATTVATTSTATTTAAASAGFAWASFVHGEGATVVLTTIDASDRRLRFLVILHLDETEAFAPAGVAIHDHFGALNRAEFGKHLVEV